MGYRIEHLEIGDTLFFNLSGETEEYMLKQLSDDVLKIIENSPVSNILVDIQNLYGRLPLPEVIFHVNDYPGFLLTRKIAIVERKENEDYYSFHQTVANNRGFSIAFFENIDSARNWLYEKTQMTGIRNTKHNELR